MGGQLRWKVAFFFQKASITAKNLVAAFQLTHSGGYYWAQGPGGGTMGGVSSSRELKDHWLGTKAFAGSQQDSRSFFPGDSGGKH